MRVRIARPTAQLDDIIRFYGNGLGIERAATFRGHDGYDGVIFDAAGTQIEFTTREGAQAPAPTEDDHLVLYYEEPGEQERVVERIRAMGYPETVPRNPWWRRRGDAFRDPDGWEVVLVRPG